MTTLLQPRTTTLSAGLLVMLLSVATAVPRLSTAQTISYQPPSRGAPSGVARVGGGTRGPSGEMRTLLSALVPDHIGLTVSEQPILYWYTSKAIHDPVEMTLLREDRVNPELELAVSPPLEAGIHKLVLAEHKVRLEPGVPYQWFVAVVLNTSQRSNDIVAGGEIQRQPVAPQLSAELESSGAGGSAAVYARSGFWYDALGALSESVEAAPGDRALRAERASLLQQGGLVEAARYELGAKL